MIVIKVPATSANLGPGYDALGMALDLWLTVSWDADAPSSIEVIGEGAGQLPAGPDNFLYRVLEETFSELTGKPLPAGRLVMESAIPLARGLGSSAAAAVAAVKLAHALAERELTVADCFRRVSALEKHLDNAAPAIVGGATLVFEDGSEPHFRRFEPPPHPMILAIPDYPVATDASRRILPPLVSREAAVFNAQRVGLWVSTLLQKDWDALRWASQDRIHQDARSALMPGFLPAVAAALSEGALFAALSGSGSSVIAMAPFGSEERIAKVMQNTFSTHGIKAHFLVTHASALGAFYPVPISL